MPVVVRDGADLYWEKIGAGPALILGAGLNGSGEWWDPNRRALAERFTVYTFDQRGTGRSSKIPVASIEQMAADLVAVMDDAGLESAHYAGHSTGGGIGVATVLDFPGRLRSAQLSNPMLLRENLQPMQFIVQGLHRNAQCVACCGHITVMLT
jgi:aminoacrylate hydrolase